VCSLSMLSRRWSREAARNFSKPKHALCVGTLAQRLGAGLPEAQEDRALHEKDHVEPGAEGQSMSAGWVDLGWRR
jgi:hypothetical protein